MSRRVRLTPRTVRERLIVVLTLVLVLGFAAAALVTVVLTHHVLTSRMDEQLRAAGGRFSAALEHADGDTDDNGGRYGQVLGQPVGTLGARIYGGKVTDAAVVSDDDPTGHVPVAAVTRLERFSAPAGPLTINLPGLGDYRILVTAGRDDDLQVTGLPAEPIERTVTELAAVVMVVFAVTLLVLVVAAAALVRVLLGPLARMSGTAAAVTRALAGAPREAGPVRLPHRVDEDATGSEIDVLAGAFNVMLEQMDSALQTRAATEERLRRFIADASHELRTPVAVVRSHAELARDEGGPGLPEGVARSLDRITAQSHRMGRLVEDLLLLARLDSGLPLAREPVDLSRLALEALDDARAAAPDHRWRLSLPPEPVVVPGDRHALGQVLSNLLANIAAHTPPGTRATLRLGLTGDNDGELTVADDGPGLPGTIGERAFDRFVRGDGQRSTAHGSSGLGLSIVAAIVQAHHGTVTLTPVHPSGTRVVVRLPGTLPGDPQALPGLVAGD